MLHELGRLVTGSGEEWTPSVTADLLEGSSVPARVLTLIGSMPDLGRGRGAEGSDEPQVLLAMADRIDHVAITAVQDGKPPGLAIRDAVEQVREEVVARYGVGSDVLLVDAREILSAMWILGRGV